MRQRREFKFTDKNIPTLAEKWDYSIPPIERFPDTPSGNRARGQVENYLDHLCKRWIVERAETMCTAEFLAREIEKIDGKPCSQGAIHSVFERWDKIDYASIGHSPLRFIGLTERGMRFGLDEIYRQEKRKRKGTTHYAWPDPVR